MLACTEEIITTDTIDIKASEKGVDAICNELDYYDGACIWTGPTFVAP